MNSPSPESRPITLLVCALGGEGGGVLTEWLVDTAHACGYAVQSTSIPGVAQRTGATTYYVEVHPVALAELGGRVPVLGLSPAPGALDGLVSSELLETVRQVGNAMSSPERTHIITSSDRTLTTAEKMQAGDARLPADALLAVARSGARRCDVLDMARMSREAGTVVSAVMLGAVAGSGLFPFARAAYESVIGAADRGGEASLRGFALGFDAVAGGGSAAAGEPANLPPHPPMDSAPALPPTLAGAFPAGLHALLRLAHTRLVEYQDERYARLYAGRLAQVLAAERAGDSGEARGWATTREMARGLAVWMAFDDIVRVADLKGRASRTRRVRAEVGARPDEVVRVHDFFKPGIPEVAGLLPPALAQRLVGWDRARRARGLDPWAFPLELATHSFTGSLVLRALASLRWLRRRGARFAAEQAAIERWMTSVVRAAARHPRLGHEIALCGRLVKGYGSTHERGREILAHILENVADNPALGSDDARADAVAETRRSATADEAGSALDRTLAALGAPARPAKIQPVRWVGRRPGGAGARPRGAAD